MNQLATNSRQGFAPTTISEAIEFSRMLADSQMVPKNYQGKPQDIMVCIQWGMEIGLAPLQALQNIAVINGKPSVYGDAAMALVQNSPVCEDIKEFFEDEGTTNPVAVCVAKRRGRNEVVARFSVEDARRAGLWGKQGPWQAYPKRMMQMRARGFALRDAFPDVLKGLITAEEAQDFPDEAKPRQVKDITPRNPLDAIAPPTMPTVEEPDDIEVLPMTEAEVMGAQETETAPEPEPQVLPEADIVPSTEAEIASEVAAIALGFELKVPGRDEAYSLHSNLDEWQDAYEELAEKTAQAGKVPARERMTKLRELKECNAETLGQIDSVKRVRSTANHSKRIKALCASLGGQT